MDVDYNSQSEEEYEYTYSEDDDDESAQSGFDDEMETASVEEDVKTGQKRKSRERTSSFGGGGFDHIMRDNDMGIHMMDSKDIVPMMKERINEVAEVLNVPSPAACVLLRGHKWAKETCFERYTEDDVKTQQKAGVYYRCCHESCERLKATSSQNRKCEICMDDDLKAEEMLAMPCGHEFCLECWEGYIKSKIDDGPSCILATCPQVGCNEIVTEEEVAKVAPDLLEKFENYQLRNFVDLNGTSRWCPGPGCERVAAINSSSGLFRDSSNCIADCDACSTKFCIKCGEEPHSPLTCRILESWKEKCQNESETANWILANTKPCPKCRSRIEKNQGCNHMTCQNCKYEFCWICSGDWNEHGATTGGYYNCNKFNADVKDSDDQSDTAKAKRELDRYLHYYSRYHGHAQAQTFAKRQLQFTEKKMIQLQEARDSSKWTDVEFLKSANEQLVECRRVLKFTYTFAYYLTMPPKTSPADKNDEKDKSKKVTKEAKNAKKKGTETDAAVENSPQNMQKDRFEYHQGILERFTEKLSELVEKPLHEIKREEVVNITRVVDQFMKNMLRYVEDGMEDVSF